MILLQTQALNANDIMFRVTDVVFIVSGVITLLTAWFAFKSAQGKTDDRISAEVARGDEKRAAIKREFEILTEKQAVLEKRIDETEGSIDNLEGELNKKIDGLGRDIQSLNLLIEKKMNEILQQLLSKKK